MMKSVFHVLSIFSLLEKNIFIALNLCLILVYASSPTVFNVDELKQSVSYVVDILDVPTLLSDEDGDVTVMRMSNKHGQEYRCKLPDTLTLTEERKVESEPEEEQLDVKELLKPMENGPCLTKTKDWWTYEFCFGKVIKQYHLEDNKVSGPVIVLGNYESDYDWAPDSEARNRLHRYHSQYYTNGTKCELTSELRRTEVRFSCDVGGGEYILRVDEPESCNYVISIRTDRICKHPLLKPPPTNKAKPITCSPVLPPGKYEIYQHYLEAKKKEAELKHKKWLEKQQEQLQNIRKEEMLGDNDDEDPVIDDEETEQETGPESVESGKTTDDSDISPKPPDNDVEKSEDLLEEEEDLKASIDNPTPNDETTEETDTIIKEELAKETAESLQSISKKLKSTNEIRENIEKQFDSLIEEAEEELNTKLSDENHEVAIEKLTETLSTLLSRLDKAERDINHVTDELDQVENTLHGLSEDAAKTTTGESAAVSSVDGTEPSTTVEDDDKVEIRRLAPSKKLRFLKDGGLEKMQIQKLEQSIKDKLVKSGLDTGGRKIEVKIITAGYFDEDDKEFQPLSDEASQTFQDMIVSLLSGNQEALEELESHQKLESNYNFKWSDEMYVSPQSTEEEEEQT